LPSCLYYTIHLCQIMSQVSFSFLLSPKPLIFKRKSRPLGEGGKSNPPISRCLRKRGFLPRLAHEPVCSHAIVCAHALGWVQHDRFPPQERGLRTFRGGFSWASASDLCLYFFDFFGHFRVSFRRGVNQTPVFLGVCEKGDFSRVQVISCAAFFYYNTHMCHIASQVISQGRR